MWFWLFCLSFDVIVRFFFDFVVFYLFRVSTLQKDKTRVFWGGQRSQHREQGNQIFFHVNESCASSSEPSSNETNEDFFYLCFRKSFCFTRSLLSVGNKHKFCSNFPCFKSESHFYPWKQSQILGKIKNKKKYAWSLYLYNWVNLGCFFFVYFLFIYLFFFGGGGVFRRKFSFSTILLFRSLVPWVQWIVLWMVIFVLNRKSSVIPHVSFLLPVIFQ